MDCRVAHNPQELVATCELVLTFSPKIFAFNHRLANAENKSTAADAASAAKTNMSHAIRPKATRRHSFLLEAHNSRPIRLPHPKLSHFIVRPPERGAGRQEHRPPTPTIN